MADEPTFPLSDVKQEDLSIASHIFSATSEEHDDLETHIQPSLSLGLLSDDFLMKKHHVRHQSSTGSDGAGTVEINGVHYNSRGYEICGQLNQHSKLCQRIGTCPFHKKPKLDDSSTPIPITPVDTEIVSALNKKPPMKKQPFKRGWTKEEHLLFLKGLKIHGKGAWKEISTIVSTRNPTQIQSHAQKYFLRQKQEVKNKRSIHDISLEDIQDLPERSFPKNKSPTMPVPRQLNPYFTPMIPQHFGLDQNLGMFFNPMAPHLPPGMASFPMPYGSPFVHQFYPFAMPFFTLNPDDPTISRQSVEHLVDEEQSPDEFPKSSDDLPQIGEKRSAYDFFSLGDERPSKHLKETDCSTQEILY